ncbi:MAG TPA: SMP-30/gluconolactonase/LRE family protein [Polyangiaceae bacterium]|nr:SMP-30/gluconolactonase/LRE family protein [Polyangiaceae bacterium]
MSLLNGRYTAAKSLSLAEGWNLERLTPPSRLFGANGLRTGPDGRIYVAQVVGSQISALDVGTGRLESISAKGGEIIAPDDVAFDPRGNLYATEYYNGRVSVRGVDGATRVLRDDVPGANGITVHKGRLFIDECRIGGRLMELDLNGGAPRVLLENLPLPNAMEVGPDGLLYYPLIGTNEIWRINPEGGTPERVAKDLGVPDAVKFDSKGFIVSTQLASGEVLRIDPRSGERSVLARLDPGLDNLTFVGDRLFVSSFTGQITEVLGAGEPRAVLPGALQWPLDLTVGDDGNLYIADGTHLYMVLPGGKLRTLGMMFSPGYPGSAPIRGLASVGGGEFIVTTSNGQVARYCPARNESEMLADGLDQLYGVAVSSSGAVLVAELGAGRVLSVGSTAAVVSGGGSGRSGQVEVLASGLRNPLGVAIGSDGACFVSESGAGRVVKLSGSRAETVLDDLHEPHGILVRDGLLYVVDAGAKTLIAFDLKSKNRRVIVSDLPVGSPPGVIPKPLHGLPPFSGPQGPFAGIAAGPDGTLYISADAEGSVLALRRGGARQSS